MAMPLPIVEPIIPKLGRAVPEGRAWVYEVKLDGFRGVFYFDGREEFFRSKRNNRMPRFADLARTITRELDVRDVILDGEVVVMGQGGPNFYGLMFRRGQPMYAAFDVCWLNGRDLRARPLRERKKILERIVRDSAIVAYVEPMKEPELFEAAARMDLEGIVAKRKDDSYAPETEWIKVVVSGYSQKIGRHEFFRGR